MLDGSLDRAEELQTDIRGKIGSRSRYFLLSMYLVELSIQINLTAECREVAQGTCVAFTAVSLIGSQSIRNDAPGAFLKHPCVTNASETPS